MKKMWLLVVLAVALTGQGAYYEYTCPKCHGKGTVKVMVVCKDCKGAGGDSGTGFSSTSTRTTYGVNVFGGIVSSRRTTLHRTHCSGWHPCKTCTGNGLLIGHVKEVQTCPKCKGEKKIVVKTSKKKGN